MHRNVAPSALFCLILLAGCRTDTGPSVYPRLVIDTFSPSTTTNTDTNLTLVDSSGTVLATDDNGNPDQDKHTNYSRIDYQVGLPSGTYYIKVHNNEPAGGAFYAIWVHDYDPGADFPILPLEAEPFPDGDDAVDGNGVPTSPVPITMGDGGAQSRAIDPEPIFPDPGDVDWFKLVLP